MNAPARRLEAALAPAAGRTAGAALHFAASFGRTVLRRQFVPYPFHITRPFRLDLKRPDLATLYLQSASGGLYRGDHLSLDLTATAGAAVHVTTQAATIVHDSRGEPASQAVTIAVAAGATVAMTPDPLILFPGADYRGTTELRIAPGGRAVLCEGFAWHDPLGQGRRFAAFSADTLIRGPDGLAAADRSDARGAELGGPASPLGPWRAFGSVYVVGGEGPLAGAEAIEAAAGAAGCASGASALPNGAGHVVRLVAEGGGMLARGLTAVSMVALEGLLGARLAPRRK